MSAQFGQCNFDGRPVESRELERVRTILAPYGPDSEGILCKGDFGVIYRAFFTSRESRVERQPYVSASGTILTWDGRLDNRADLIHELAPSASMQSSDAAIVAAAHERHGTSCFPSLIGDWSLTLWDPRNRTLILAKDFLGSRHLYYSVERDRVLWSTMLDPLILLARYSLILNEAYMAGWLALFPSAELTPFVGIHSVPPSSMVVFKRDMQQISKYWDFDPANKIHHRDDREYEEQFRVEFGRAVRRRLRSDIPVMAELSGGMDSSSIVCMADEILARGEAETPRVDTLSYYDDSEPNWNEYPYFTAVEKQRGRAGHHIFAGEVASMALPVQDRDFALIPGAIEDAALIPKEFLRYISSCRARVILSGIGGDEVAGGVPAAIPELADLLVQGNVRALSSALRAWSFGSRKPWSQLLRSTLGCFLPAAIVAGPQSTQPPLWLQHDFVKRNRQAWVRTRFKIGGARPSFQVNMAALDHLRRILAWLPLPSRPVYERRYPYLDRDFLGFLFAIPRAQLVRPGQRRSLVRRALKGLIPETVLNRKRKGYANRLPRTAALELMTSLMSSNRDLLASSMGILDRGKLLATLEELRQGLDAPTNSLMRTLTLESWLRALHPSELPGKRGYSVSIQAHRLLGAGTTTSDKDRPLEIQPNPG